MDDQNQQNNQNPNPDPNDQNYVSGGSIEAGPAMPQAEQAQERPEYGHEIIKRIETSAETALEQAERKESYQPDDPARQQAYADDAAKKEKKSEDPVAPQYYGYNIPPQIANNYEYVKASAGKGDPSQSRTWIFMLLDRMLKMRSR